LHKITAYHNELSVGTNIDEFEPQNRSFSKKNLRFQAATHISRVNCAEITGDRPR